MTMLDVPLIDDGDGAKRTEDNGNDAALLNAATGAV